MQLSRFFSLAEMTSSDTAARENIPNQPAGQEGDHLRALCTVVLDPLREAVGIPIKVNSGYRSPALNTRIGGATGSQHVEGKAADIQAPGLSVLELFKTVVRSGLPFDQVIYEAQSRAAKWVHVSHDPTRARGEIRVAEFGPDGRPRAYPVFTAEAALAMTEPATRSRAAPALEYVELGDEPDFESPSEPPMKRRISRRPSTKRPASGRKARKADTDARRHTAARKAKQPSRKSKKKTAKRAAPARARRRRA